VKLEDWQRTLDVNLTGMFRARKAIRLKQSANGSAGESRRPPAATGSRLLPSGQSGASSAFQVAVDRAGRRGLRVNTICPGAVAATASTA
jgi:NAD(P)-dependent dehydrogenase (short-subunit alcohol dehydrogenase family)